MNKIAWSDWLSLWFWRYCWQAKTWEQFRCRAYGHPNGVWWYNMSGYEPDMTCKDCGEDLG